MALSFGAIALIVLCAHVTMTVAASCDDACCDIKCKDRPKFANSDKLTSNTLLTTVYSAPEDMADSDSSFGGSGGVADDDSDCAIVHSITRDDAAGVFRINVTLSLGGKGCNKTIPWTVAPRRANQTVYGAGALTRCDATGGGCTRISAGPLKGLTVAAPPPVYRAPLTSPQNSLSDKPVPFGYTGYHVYETSSKGTCGKYGFGGLSTGTAGTMRKNGPVGVALAAPMDNECNGTVPQQGAFVSRLSPKRVAQRLSAYLNVPRGTTNATQFILNMIDLTLNNSALADARESLPYGYLDIASLIDVAEPFACGANLSAPDPTHKLGIGVEETHSCPMTPVEWELILPDVAEVGLNVDEILGPASSVSYSAAERDGGWIVPTDTLGTLPPVCYRCSAVRSEGMAGNTRVTNYASRHMPISMSFGPQCAGLTVADSRGSVRVAVGAYVGISSTNDPYDGRWSHSAAFPVRYARAIGVTRRNTSTRAPGTVPGAQIDGDIEWHKGTSGAALRVDLSALRYILCNGGGASLMRAGVNTTTARHIGPLVSRLRNTSEPQSAPAWPNPFRYAALPGMPNCAGCTYPTLSTQKGWTVMDSQIWHYGQHGAVGGMHADHSLWSRVMALVNGTEGLYEDFGLNIFSKWNDTDEMPTAYAEGARALSQDTVVENIIDNLSTLGIPGIGQYSWVSSMCDYMQYAGRPIPSSHSTRVSQGTTATPFCALLRRQLYAQSEARIARGQLNASATANLADLGSAARTGIFNALAPNVWFGIWQRGARAGGSQWNVFLDDTWDRTGRSGFGVDGIADNAHGSMQFEVPISDVETLDGPDVFSAHVFGDQCGTLLLHSPLTQRFKGRVTFSSASASVTTLIFTFTPYNCDNTVTYNTSDARFSTSPLSVSNALVTLGTPDRRTAQKPIIFEIAYDTVDLNVTYDMSFPFVCTQPVDTSEEFGFALSVEYVQYISPGNTETNTLIDQPIVGTCSRDTADDHHDDAFAGVTFDMSNLAPPADSLPIGYSCSPVYTRNPLDGGYHFVSDANDTITFDDAAKQFVTFVCYSFATIENPEKHAACNVTGDGKRSGNCAFYEDTFGPQCTQFWNLRCTPWNDGQFGFFLLVLALFAMTSTASVYGCVECARGRRHATRGRADDVGEPVHDRERKWREYRRNVGRVVQSAMGSDGLERHVRDVPRSSVYARAS